MRRRWWVGVGVSLGMSIGVTAGALGLLVPLTIANGLFVIALMVVLAKRVGPPWRPAP